MIDSEIEMKELGRKHPTNYSQQKIADPNLSLIPKTSGSQKKPPGGRV